MSSIFLIVLAATVIVIGFALVGLWSYFTQNQNADDAWVTIYEVADTAQLAFFKSLLESENIPYAAVGERAQDLFGLGRLGTGYNMIVGPVRLQVPIAQAEEAKSLLQGALQAEELNSNHETHSV